MVALPLALVFFNAIRWGDDVLFFVLAEIMLGSGLLVVTMRDIIRWALAMIVLLPVPRPDLRHGPARHSSGRRELLVYVGAISVLVLFAIMC